MSRLWDRGQPTDAAVLRLTVGRDPELDLQLLSWDCLASAAHARMLESIGLLTEEERGALERELARIAAEARQGRFPIAVEDEDGHTAIEGRLTERLGATGRKIHTGRSRNDQVIAALRLWGRAAVLDQVEGVLAVAERLFELAAETRTFTVPGYTHTRQAMPTTVGHVLAAWAEGLVDDLPWLRTAFEHLDRSPLGSASGFGVPLALDRALVADLLGFSTVQRNTLAVQNERGKSEALALAAAAAAATDLGRFAGELIWWSSDELRFARLAPEATTGSSLMPQKRNPDLLELVRAGAARLRSRQAEVAAIYGGLTGGYHRDLQLTKEPFLDGMQGLVDLAAATRIALAGIQFDAERCAAALQPGTGATDALFASVAAGEPFRDAYRRAAREPEREEIDPAAAWRNRTAPGAPGDPELVTAPAEVAAAAAWLAAQRNRLASATSWFEISPDGDTL